MTKTCFCPGCKTGYASDRRERKKLGEKSLSMFGVPKDPILFQMWQKAIPRADRLLTQKDGVCIKHFKKEDVLYQKEPLKLFDGSVYIQELEVPRLRKGALPCIFDGVPGHSTYVQKMKTGDKNRKSRKLYGAPNKLMAHKALNNSLGTEITETKKYIPSKEKENVLTTNLSLLPEILLNCLTSVPHTVLTNLNKSVEKDNFSSESNNLQFDVKQSTLEENDVSYKQSKPNCHLKTKILERISSLSPKSSLLMTSTISQEIVQPLDSQSNLIHSEVNPKQPGCMDDSTTKSCTINQPLSSLNILTPEPSNNQSNLIHPEGNDEQSSCMDDSTTEPSTINQPSSPLKILTTEPDIIPEPLNNQSDSREESEHILQPLNVTAATEVPHQHQDTNVTETEDCSLIDSEIGVDLPLSVAKKKLCFNFLKTNAHTINKMNSWWTINTFDNFIICARWNLDCLVERKIVIYEDLKIKVFLREKETILGNGLEAKSIDTISHLIFKVERIRICRNILKRQGNCSGFLQAHYMCRRKDCCLNCIEWEKEKWEEYQQLKKQKVSQNQVELIRFYMSS